MTTLHLSAAQTARRTNATAAAFRAEIAATEQRAEEAHLSHRLHGGTVTDYVAQYVTLDDLRRDLTDYVVDATLPYYRASYTPQPGEAPIHSAADAARTVAYTSLAARLLALAPGHESAPVLEAQAPTMEDRVARLGTLTVDADGTLALYPAVAA